MCVYQLYFLFCDLSLPILFIRVWICFLSICMSFIIKIALGLSFYCRDLSFDLLFGFSFAIFEEHSESFMMQNSSLFFWFIFFTFFKVRKVSPQEQKSDFKIQFSSVIWFPIFNHLIHLEYFWYLAQMSDLATSCSPAADNHTSFIINSKIHLCVPIWVNGIHPSPLCCPRQNPWSSPDSLLSFTPHIHSTPMSYGSIVWFFLVLFWGRIYTGWNTFPPPHCLIPTSLAGGVRCVLALCHKSAPYCPLCLSHPIVMSCQLVCGPLSLASLM